MSVTGSAADQTRKGNRKMGCAFSMVLLFGLGFSLFFAWPIVQIVQARSWRETPCTILTSEVEHFTGERGRSTYRIGVTYEYFVNDQRHVSSRYKFMTWASSGHEGKKEVVDRLQPGVQTVCYVNRRDPSEAVLERGYTSDLWFGLIPLLFVLIGGVGLIASFISKAQPRSPHARPSVSAPPAPADPAAPPVGPKGKLKASTSPMMRFGCVTLIALFWNGIVSVFVFGDGSMDGCSIVFMIPFVLVGLGLLGFMGYCFLGLFNPRPSLRMSGEAALGEAIDIEWEMTGNAEKMKLFTITLEGREEATYRRGTSTSTDKSVFASIELVRVTHPKEMKRGRVKAAIPADTMHSFASTNNKFVWQLKVVGEIPRWPDVGEDYDIDVKPRKTGGAR